jgi:AcrR family transcriptional regulator
MVPLIGVGKDPMGKQAETKVQAGAEGIGATREVEAPSHAPTLRLVTSQKRQRIMIGMLEAVGASGYDTASVRMVLDRTGLYRQAFYDNFTGKDDCYLEAFDAGVERVEALMIAAARSEESWHGKLRAGLGTLLDFLEAEPEIGRALIVEVHAAGLGALAKRAEALKRAANFIDLARLESKGSEPPPSIAAEGIVSGIHAVIHSRLSSEAEEGLRKLLPEFMYFAVLPYFGAGVAGAEMEAARA